MPPFDLGTGLIPLDIGPLDIGPIKLFADCCKVKHIQHNPEKGATAVTFDDGKVIVVRRAPDQPDDIYFAVASAIAEHLYGSNSAFKKMISSKTEVIHKKGKVKK